VSSGGRDFAGSHGRGLIQSSAAFVVPWNREEHLNRRVPEPELDDFRVLTLDDEHRRMGIAEVMKPERLANRGADSRKPPGVRVPGVTAWQSKEVEVAGRFDRCFPGRDPQLSIDGFGVALDRVV